MLDYISKRNIVLLGVITVVVYHFSRCIMQYPGIIAEIRGCTQTLELAKNLNF